MGTHLETNFDRHWLALGIDPRSPVLSIMRMLEQNLINFTKFQSIHLFFKGLPSVSNKGSHSFHTVRFSEVWQNPFVTKVVRTLRDESSQNKQFDQMVIVTYQWRSLCPFWERTGLDHDKYVRFVPCQHMKNSDTMYIFFLFLITESIRTSLMIKWW